MITDAAVTLCEPVVARTGWVCSIHGTDWNMVQGLCGTVTVLREVLQERARQFSQYGTNSDLEDGTGPNVPWLEPLTLVRAALIEDYLRQDYEGKGKPTWMRLIREEVAEAFTESDPVRLREELLQVAALCCSWVERLDERSTRWPTSTATED